MRVDKEKLKENLTAFGCGIGEINDRMGEYRKHAKSEIADVTERRRFLRKKLDEELDKSGS